MFAIGLEFNLHKIAEVGRGAIITAFMENDIIWCIGTQDMVDKLEADGMLML